MAGQTLTRKDLRAVLDFIGAAAAATDLDDLAAHIAYSSGSVIGNEVASYNEINARRRRASWIASDHSPFAEDVKLFEELIPEHPMIAHFEANPDGSAVKLSDLTEKRRWRRTRLYNEFYRPKRIESMLAANIGGGPLKSCVVVCRERGDFSERDRACLDLMRTHLAHAYRNVALRTDYRVELALLHRALDSQGFGAILLRSDGTPRAITERARSLLKAYFGATGAATLPQPLAAWIKQSELPATTAGSDGFRPPRSLLVEGIRRRLVAQLLRDGDQSVVLLREQRMTVAPGDLAPLGLTAREAEVLAALALGRTDREIGAILDISRRTVSHTLEKIYRKLGVETRLAAAMRALNAAEPNE